MCVCYPLTQDVVTFGFLTDGARRQTASACRLRTVVDTVMNWQIGGGGGSSSSSSSSSSRSSNSSSSSSSSSSN